MPLIIEKNPKVLGGIPVIKGTRIPISRIGALLGLEYNLRDLKKEYPQLKKITNKQFEEIGNYFYQKLAY